MLCERISIKVEGSAPETALYTYMLEESKEFGRNRLRPLVLLCPGGGYCMTSDREAEPLALKFLAEGYNTAVIRYSVAPAVYPTALLELAAAVRIIKQNAEKWGVDINNIIIQGCSAGGHLAADYAVSWSDELISSYFKEDKEVFRPAGLMLCYPVITSGKYAHESSFKCLLGDRYDEMHEELSLENKVNKDVPPTFLWHTQPDATVPIENSVMFLSALVKHKIPTEFHMYPVGGHGLGLANEITVDNNGYGIQHECEGWIQLACTWLDRITAK